LFFSRKSSKYRLASGLCRDPLGELKRPPDLSPGRGRDGNGREGRIGAIGNDGEEGKGEREGGAAQPYKFSKVGAYAGQTCISSLKV